MKTITLYFFIFTVILMPLQKAFANANNSYSVQRYGTVDNNDGKVFIGKDPQTGDNVISVRPPKAPPTQQQNVPIYVYPQVTPSYPGQVPGYSPQGPGYTPKPVPQHFNQNHVPPRQLKLRPLRRNDSASPSRPHFAPQYTPRVSHKPHAPYDSRQTYHGHTPNPAFKPTLQGPEPHFPTHRPRGQ